ncbi:CopG family transcriptional regulator [bacterium]|nr:CopG family transcriptional regulator [bacterium]
MSETRSDRDALLESFDAGEDMDRYFDFDHPETPNREVKRVNVDFPVWMVTALDSEAARVGVNRQAVIKMWISERLDDERAKRNAARLTAV